MHAQFSTRNHLTRTTWKIVVVVLAVAFASAFVPVASAKCGPSLGVGPSSAKPMFAPRPQSNVLRPVSYTVSSAAVVRDDDRAIESDGNDSIVGLWSVTWTSKGNENNPAPFNPPDGAQLDAGYVQWHSDGTEIMNSERDPATGSFCMGVWKRSGPSTYKLNHFALSWDATGTSCPPSAQPGATGCFEGLTRVHQEVTVDRTGQHYHGTLTIDQYDPSGAHVLFELKGIVSADRITADQ
jgi:hypothetical protein